MVQPVRRIGTAEAAEAAARSLEMPSDVRLFELQAKYSAVLREFLTTPEWAAIRVRIMGDGNQQLRPRTLADFAVWSRWTADGYFDGRPLSDDAREAYLHMAAEIETSLDTQAAAARTVTPPAEIRPAA